MSKAQTWQQHFTAWQESGLSQTEFCKLHAIKQHNWYYWRKRLTPAVDKPKALIPITVIRSAPARLHLGSQVVIELPCENLPGLLLVLRDRGLLNASS